MAWVKLAFQLGHPAARHYTPHHAPHPQNPQPRRSKGPARLQKDLERAAAHRQKQFDLAEAANDELELSAAVTADTPPLATSDQPSTTAEEIEAVEVSTSSTPTSPITATTTPLTSTPAATADPDPTPAAVSVAPTPPRPEVVPVYCLATFENCPDSQLSQDYGDSLKRFLTSEPHLEQNIATAEFQHQSSRSLRNNMNVHTVSVVVHVRTAKLWESPASYVRKHLGLTNYWSRSNGSVVKLSRIHQK